MRQQHQALGSIISANPSQSNPPTLTPTLIPFSISKPFPLSHSPSPNSTASSSLRTPMYLRRQNLSGTLSILPRTNRRSAKKKKRKESSECSRVWRNGRDKKEERMIKKKRERVHVWRRKKEGKKRRRKKCHVWRIKKEEEKKEKRRMKYYHNIFIVFSQ